jgi:hypothetical protein
MWDVCESVCVWGGGGGLQISQMMTQCSSVNDLRCLFVFCFLFVSPCTDIKPPCKVKNIVRMA